MTDVRGVIAAIDPEPLMEVGARISSGDPKRATVLPSARRAGRRAPLGLRQVIQMSIEPLLMA